jgi:hypothetical protein
MLRFLPPGLPETPLRNLPPGCLGAGVSVIVGVNGCRAAHQAALLGLTIDRSSSAVASARGISFLFPI